MLSPIRTPACLRDGCRSGFAIVSLIVVAGAAPATGAETGDLRTLRAEALALALVNEDRGRHGLEPLALTESLNEAAQNHADDMLRRGYCAHASPEGDTVQELCRVAEAQDDRPPALREGDLRRAKAAIEAAQARNPAPGSQTGGG